MLPAAPPSPTTTRTVTQKLDTSCSTLLGFVNRSTEFAVNDRPLDKGTEREGAVFNQMARNIDGQLSLACVRLQLGSLDTDGIQNFCVNLLDRQGVLGFSDLEPGVLINLTHLAQDSFECTATICVFVSCSFVVTITRTSYHSLHTPHATACQDYF